ncbi:hypothetical protein [Herbidospora daliensis]|uniref:hypothetical protein n=1 Tax=Herbidospora daliensis TaxID=295585 RepID=UPI000783CC39|nr:hypothetical protein [Herbidospora daliensis]
MPPKTRSTTARKPAVRKAPAKRKKARRKIVKARITIALFRCKTCRRGYNWPFGHVCMVGATPAQRAAALKNIALARKAKAQKRRWW